MTISAFSQDNERPEVSWVNPKLPESPGLSHQILTSNALGHDVGYVVWTPPEYNENTNKHYPVIYFLHGMGGNESADSGGFSSRVARAIKEGVVPPVICVFPNGGRSGYRNEVERMLIDELIPTIDQNYRTITKSSSRALAGFSMGGMGSVRLTVNYPKLFCLAASWGGGARENDSSLFDSVTEQKEVFIQNQIAFLQIKGDQDRFTKGNEAFAKHLDEQGITNKLIVLSDTSHNLGHYYERSSDAMMAFIGKHIQSSSKKMVLTKDAVDESAGNLPCYKIETPVATYYLEKTGAGLSSLIDIDGNDWISFHPEAGSGAGGEYRGFPNAVHQQDGSFFHPKNEGTEPSTVELIKEDPNHISFKATTHTRTWQAQWDFYPTHCTFTMTKMPVGYKYWVLYEGTPGGDYDDDDWWMTSAIHEKHPLTKNHEGDIPGPEWIAFGDKDINRSLVLLHHQDDEEIDRFYQMEHKMTVFGFGRRGIDKFLDTVPKSFTIGLIETTNHESIQDQIKNIIRD